MAREKLGNPHNRKRILERLELTGQDFRAFDGIVSRSTFYNYLKKHPEFAAMVEDAKDAFRKTLWKERPDLKRLAIEGLEKNLKEYVQKYEKIIYTLTVDSDGSLKRIPTRAEVTKVTRNPQKWAIELVLGLRKDVKDTDDDQPVFDDVVFLK